MSRIPYEVLDLRRRIQNFSDEIRRLEAARYSAAQQLAAAYEDWGDDVAAQVAPDPAA